MWALAQGHRANSRQRQGWKPDPLLTVMLSPLTQQEVAPDHRPQGAVCPDIPDRSPTPSSLLHPLEELREPKRVFSVSSAKQSQEDKPFAGKSHMRERDCGGYRHMETADLLELVRGKVLLSVCFCYCCLNAVCTITT